jgi:AAA+ superfamily predicted ATPase
LLSAVAANPDDVPLRLHLVDLLIEADRRTEAVTHLAQVLVNEPDNATARDLMARAIQPASPAPVTAPPALSVQDDAPPADAASRADAAPSPVSALPSASDVDWTALEREFADLVPPRFVDDDAPAGPVVEVESSTITLADVGGLDDVKRRLELAFFGPLRDPKMRQLYGASLRGGLLLYGPPGCGKTFLARAVAGEMGAKFITVSITDILDAYAGKSEQNLHEIFESARASAPCVLFLDEIDALGHKRSQMSSGMMRNIGNQLLAELDGMEGVNEGMFVLGATNAPWDVDSALRRPGRFDRVVLVQPPDQPARMAILKYHLRSRPVAGIDVKKLAAATDGYSGADLAHLCSTAAEHAMADSMATGQVRMIEQADFNRALREVNPSIGPWLRSARNVAMFANDGGLYDDLIVYLRKNKKFG